MQIYDGRESFYQWDIDQKITSTDWMVGDEIHFYNLKQTTALVVHAYELNGKVVADVPNILLQSSHPLTIYRYIADSTGQYTFDEQTFKVNQRVKPDDYVYTETEVLNYRILDERITAIEQNGGSGGSGGDNCNCIVDQNYRPESENAQSGKAVAESVKNKANKSTTLSGYGITDAYTQTEVDDKIDILQSDISGLQAQLNEEAHFRGYLSTNAKIQALEATPNDFAYSAESGTKWVYDSENGWQDTGTSVPDQLTPASESTPLMNGTASVGTANEYARGDHRHPTDTTRVSVVEFNDFKLELETSLDNIISKYGLDGVDV